MKITITQIVLEFPEQEQPAPVREPNPLDTLLALLFLDAKNEPKPREATPHGPIFKV